ncbi:hypothetical protein GCM10023116_30830 [Kistimonas scapharcae]|uniref:Uncharacterized protein n=1 Tax=Kistimonas scapharcae TaxID=1036133 RepID=A0ABP8V6B9_9GAMM
MKPPTRFIRVEESQGSEGGQPLDITLRRFWPVGYKTIRYGTLVGVWYQTIIMTTGKRFVVLYCKQIGQYSV